MEASQANPNWTHANEDYLTRSFPIHRACRDGDTEQLASLLSAGDVDLYEEDDFYGWTPVHWAAYFGKLACLRRLINTLESVGVNGCNLVSSRFAQTPTHLCAYSCHPQCLYWLVQSNCDLDAQDYMGETPVHKAARTGSMECVSLLVSQGAKLSIRNHSNCTPSQVAATAGHQECADYLERAAQIQSQALGVHHEMRTPVAHPSNNGINPIVNPFAANNGRTSPEGQSCVQTHHFISTDTYHSQPHIATNGTAHHPYIENGLNNNNQSEDCDMEMEDGHCNNGHSAVHEMNGFSHLQQNGDVLLSHGVSQNLVPLAGRKRSREDVEPETFKRARQDESLTDMNKNKLNGWLVNNGHMTHQLTNHMGDHVTPVSDSMVEHFTSVSVQQGYDSLMLDAMLYDHHGS